MATGAAAI
jgi:hypothetical protein